MQTANPTTATTATAAPTGNAASPIQTAQLATAIQQPIHATLLLFSLKEHRAPQIRIASPTTAAMASAAAQASAVCLHQTARRVRSAIRLLPPAFNQFQFIMHLTQRGKRIQQTTAFL